MERIECAHSGHHLARGVGVYFLYDYFVLYCAQSSAAAAASGLYANFVNKFNNFKVHLFMLSAKAL